MHSSVRLFKHSPSPSLLLALILLTACASESDTARENSDQQNSSSPSNGSGSGSSDGTTPLGPSEPVRDLSPPIILGGDTSAISGLWDRSIEGNIFYTYIGENGEFTIYDYDQDSNGTGLNCYRLHELNEDSGGVLRPHDIEENLYFFESYYYQLVDEYANTEELRHNLAIYKIERLSDTTLSYQGIESVMGDDLNVFQVQAATWNLVNGVTRDDLNVCVNHPLD